MRPDQLPVPPDRRRLDAPPLARAVPGHVRHHAMRMQLRVEIAARKVPEGRRNHAVRLHPRTPPRRRVPAPRLQQLRLHPVQRRPHRLVMRADDPPVAVQQRRQRDRLRRRQRDVQPRTVLVLAVAHAAEADVRARHMSQQDRVEALRRDMTTQPQHLCCRPVPEARLTMLRVPLRVVAVLLEIVDRRTRGTDVRDRGDHGGILAAADRARMVAGNGQLCRDGYVRRPFRAALGTSFGSTVVWIPSKRKNCHVRRTNRIYLPLARP